MALAAHNFAIQDDAGNLVTDVDIEVRHDVVGQPLVQLYSDRDGAVAIGNPFTSATGVGRFHVGGGAYQIRAFKDGFEAIQRYVGIGTAGESDADAFDPAGSAAAVFDAVAPLESIAALRLLDTNDTRTVVYVTGYYAGSTKGGGWFVRLGGSPALADDGFLYFQDAVGRSWNRVIGGVMLDAFYKAGAVGDGAINSSTYAITGTDDSTAINKVTAWLATLADVGSRAAPMLVHCGAGIFRCDSPINLTALRSVRFYFDCRGTVIASRAAGKAAVDATETDGVWLSGLHVVGDPTDTPAVGIFLCRIAGSTDDIFLERCRTDGYFTYAAVHNSGSENVTLEQCFFRNWGTGDCYGFAQDSLAFLRYDPPVTPSGGNVFAENPLRIAVAGHGLTTGDKIYIEDLGRVWTVTVLGVNQFTVPYDGTSYAGTGKYFKQRYGSDWVDDEDDTIVPYVGNGAFTLDVRGGQMWAPYGKASILDTPGGRRKWNCRAVAGIHDDTTTSDIAITSSTSGTITTGAVHGLTTGDVIWVEGTDDTDNNNEFFRVASTPTTTTLTVGHIDGTSKTFDDCTGGTLRKQDISGGYAVHLIGSDFEGPEYNKLHLESAAIAELTHEPGAHFYVQNIDQLNDGGAAQPVRLQGFRFLEHASNGIYGTFVVDTASVSAVVLTGEITLPRISASYGDGNTAGKLFNSPSLWTVRARVIAGDTTIIHDDVDFQGDFIDAETGANVGQSHGKATSLTTDSNGDIFIPHGLYKDFNYAAVGMVGNSSQQINVFSASTGTDIRARVRDAAGTPVTSTAINDVWWAARV